MAKKENQDNFEPVVGQLSSRIDWLQKITSGALIALAVGFVAIFVSAVAIFYDAYTNKAATYLQLTHEVKNINQKLDIVLETCSSGGVE